MLVLHKVMFFLHLICHVIHLETPQLSSSTLDVPLRPAEQFTTAALNYMLISVLYYMPHIYSPAAQHLMERVVADKRERRDFLFHFKT